MFRNLCFNAHSDVSDQTPLPMASALGLRYLQRPVLQNALTLAATIYYLKEVLHHHIVSHKRNAKSTYFQ